MNTMINKYANKYHYTAPITVTQYRTRKVKGNGNIRAFIGMCVLMCVITAVCYVVSV